MHVQGVGDVELQILYSHPPVENYYDIESKAPPAPMPVIFEVFHFRGGQEVCLRGNPFMLRKHLIFVLSLSILCLRML